MTRIKTKSAFIGVDQRPVQSRKVILADAAHLPNMDQPEAFQGIVQEFLANLSS